MCFPSKYLALLAYIFFIGHLSGQNINTDSLVDALGRTKGPEKLEALLSLNRHYLFISTDSCIKYGDLAIELAKELKEIKKEALANKRIGYSLYRSGDYKTSLPYFARARELFIQSDSYLDAAIISNFFGDAYNHMGDYNIAMDWFLDAEANCDSLFIHDTLKESVKRLYSILYTNIGLLYNKLDSLEKPLSYFRLALRWAEDIGDSTRIAASLSNIGMIYKQKNEYDSAFIMYFNALAVARRIGEKHYESAILNNLANIYELRGEPDSAMRYFRLAKSIITRIDDKFGLALVNRNIASIYLAKGDPDSAQFFAESAFSISREINAQKQLYLAYEILADIDGRKGQTKEAFEYYKKYAELKDSVSGRETREKIAEIHTRYETEKKEKENLELRKDNEIKAVQIRAKNSAILLLVTGIILTITFLVIIFSQLHQKKKAYNDLVRKNLEIAYAGRKLAEKEELCEAVAGTSGMFSSENQEDQLLVKLNQYLKREKPFLLHNITIDDISKELGTNRTYLSKAIRDGLNHNFNSMINELRIREARQMLADNKYCHISVEGIGQMVGFSSKSSFYKYFKDSTGVTPSFFREKAIS